MADEKWVFLTEVSSFICIVYNCCSKIVLRINLNKLNIYFTLLMIVLVLDILIRAFNLTKHNPHDDIKTSNIWYIA